MLYNNLGDHSRCKGKCSKTDLRSFFAQGNGQLAYYAIKAHLTDEEKIFQLCNTGETSTLEAFNSLVYSMGFLSKLQKKSQKK